VCVERERHREREKTDRQTERGFCVVVFGVWLCLLLLLLLTHVLLRDVLACVYDIDVIY